MKQWIKGLIFIAPTTLILLACLWWVLKSPLKSGLYIDKNVGTVVLKVEENSPPEFEIPFYWIKKDPWEEPPMLENLTLIDQEGDIMAMIDGGYSLTVMEHKWNERVVKAEVIFHLNSVIEMEEWDYHSKALPYDFKKTYYPAQLSFLVNREEKIFSMKDTYQMIPIDADLVSGNSIGVGMEAFTYIFENLHFTKKKGYLVQLNVKPNYSLEDIYFWFPGMPESYYEEVVKFSYDDVDDYLNEYDFEGEPLSLPLDLDTHQLLIYFPITLEMEERITDAVTYGVPYFKFTDEKGDVFYFGGMGSIGPFDRDTDWSERLIMPEN